MRVTFVPMASMHGVSRGRGGWPFLAIIVCIVSGIARSSSAGDGAMPPTTPSPALATALEDELAILLGWVVGEFDNRRQVDSGENFLLETPADPAKAPDLLYPVFARVEAPALGRHVVYLQWPIGSPQGALQRQRIWSFEVDPQRNAVMMDFYTLREPARWRDAQLRPQIALRDIRRDDVIPYPPTCRLPFRRHADVFIGEIPSSCRITSQQTRTDMTIRARIVVGRDQIWYQESGVRADGSVVFQVPVAGSYQFRRRAR